MYTVCILYMYTAYAWRILYGIRCILCIYLYCVCIRYTVFTVYYAICTAYIHMVQYAVDMYIYSIYKSSVRNMCLYILIWLLRQPTTILSLLAVRLL